MKNYYEKLCQQQKKNDLKEMDNYVELYNLPRLNQRERKANNRQITRKVIESVI